MSTRKFMYLVLIFIIAAVMEELIVNYLSSGLQAGAPEGTASYSSLSALCESAAANCRGLKAAANLTCEDECWPCELLDGYLNDTNMSGYKACLAVR